MMCWIALMAEELGEISAYVTKGRGTACLAEECADLMTLVLGTAISANFNLGQAFWNKMKQLDHRGSRSIKGRIRVSEFN
jgi:NTP pyrophosphatase (non-canonical NTP hydrolase)